MEDLKTEFDNERFPFQYILATPDRMKWTVQDYLHEIARDQNIELRVAAKTVYGEDGVPMAAIGIALTSPDQYAQLMRKLDETIYAERVADIEHGHGAANPLNRYLRQLEDAGAADPETREAFSDTIARNRTAALEEARSDWDTVRKQWADDTAPGLIEPP